MATVKRKTAKRTAAKKRTAAGKSTKRAKPKTGRTKTVARANRRARKKTAKKAVKKASSVKRVLSAAEKAHIADTEKRKTAARKTAAVHKAVATRKANARKAKRSAAAKKTAKRAAPKKTATKRTARRHLDGRSREARARRRGHTYVKDCAKLLLQGKYTDTEIRDRLAKTFGERYSGGKHTRHIRKYRSLLNSGGLEYAGFVRPPKPVQEVGRTSGAEEAGLSKRQVRRRRREIREKLGPRAKYARRQRLQSRVSSPGSATTGNSSLDPQPIARRARRR